MCEHSSLSAVNERITETEYREYVILEYDLTCNDCNTIVDKERVKYKSE
jgi:hypothetical protein